MSLPKLTQLTNYCFDNKLCSYSLRMNRNTLNASYKFTNLQWFIYTCPGEKYLFVLLRINAFQLFVYCIKSCYISGIDMVLCSGSTMSLSCSSSTIIRIDSAVYGHYDSNVCSGPDYTTNCHQDGDFDIVDDLCSGEESCDINVGIDTFGSDPCPNSQKYLDLTYTCIASREYSLQIIECHH